MHDFFDGLVMRVYGDNCSVAKKKKKIAGVLRPLHGVRYLLDIYLVDYRSLFLLPILYIWILQELSPWIPR